MFLVVNTEEADVRVGNDNTWVAEQVFSFGLDIAESTAHRETAWEDSVGTHYYLCVVWLCED